MSDPSLSWGDNWALCCVCFKQHDAPYPDLHVDAQGQRHNVCKGMCAELAGLEGDPILEALCRASHDAYEQAAAGAGWATNPESRKPWEDVPEANKVAMRAAISAIRPLIEREVREQVARDIDAEREKLEQWSSIWSRPLAMAAAIARGGDHE